MRSLSNIPLPSLAFRGITAIHSIGFLFPAHCESLTIATVDLAISPYDVRTMDGSV